MTLQVKMIIYCDFYCKFLEKLSQFQDFFAPQSLKKASEILAGLDWMLFNWKRYPHLNSQNGPVSELTPSGLNCESNGGIVDPGRKISFLHILLPLCNDALSTGHILRNAFEFLM